jgi:hypothetical protein
MIPPRLDHPTRRGRRGEAAALPAIDSVAGGASAQYSFDLGTLKSSWPASYLWGADPFLPEHYKTGLAKRTQYDAPGSAPPSKLRPT